MFQRYRKKLGIALLVSGLLAQNVSAASAGPTPTAMEPEKLVAENSDEVCVISGKEKATDAKIALSYNGKAINTKSTPVIYYQGEYLVAFEPVLVKKGPKVTYEWNETVGHVELIYQNHVVTFYIGDDYLYGTGEKISLGQAIVQGQYRSNGKSYFFVSLTKLCSALGFTYQWDIKNRVCAIKGKKVTFSGKSTTTNYAYSRTAFAKKESRIVRSVSYKKYLTLITKSKDTTQNFKYLRIDQYREVDQKKFTKYYQYLIRDYCRSAGISVKKSSLYGKASTFLKAAKKYQLDPIYLVNQTFLESAYGTSELASGNRIKTVAKRGYPKTKRGKFKTKKLKKSIKVYNLYGINADDTDPYVGGTSYAYYHDWTSVTKAIYGAASYLKKNYIYGSFRQNTVFKMRYTFQKNIWHQYATDPYYAEKIGIRMYLMSSCYADNAEFLYDYPKYR